MIAMRRKLRRPANSELPQQTTRSGHTAIEHLNSQRSRRQSIRRSQYSSFPDRQLRRPSTKHGSNNVTVADAFFDGENSHFAGLRRRHLHNLRK
jgi:hypothetical protein